MTMKADAKNEGLVAQQERAQSLAEKIRSQGRKTIVIEFAGLPKAGKSTTLSSVQMFLKRCGISASVVVERASVCPIRDKKHAHFNAWTASTTLSQVLEKTQDPAREGDPDVLFLDRGLFDSICWFRMMERLCRIRHDERMNIENFLRMHEWSKKLAAVVLMTADPGDCLAREQGLLPVRGGKGSIMNEEVLSQLAKIYKGVANDFSNELDVIEVNTSAPALNSAQAAAEHVLGKVLDVLEGVVEERILCLPTQLVESVFASSWQVSLRLSEDLENRFRAEGIYKARRDVENDVSLVQALPSVVVRTASGDVLVLLRKEASRRNQLHGKYVIWAGGHVREEDDQSSPVRFGAVRELQEELRLSVTEDQLKLLGAVYDRSNARSSRHVAIIYEWRATSDDVAIALSSDEFFESHGTSLSGGFVSLKVLQDHVVSESISEPWSVRIAQILFDENGLTSPGKLV